MRSLGGRRHAADTSTAKLANLAGPDPSPLQLPGGRSFHFGDVPTATDEWNNVELQLRPPPQAGQPARACVLLQNADLDGQGALPTLLGALLPSRGASLAALDLDDCWVTADSFAGPACRALLAPLTHLMLKDCYEHTAWTDAALQRALGVLLSLTPCLRRLHFMGAGSPWGDDAPGHCLSSGLPPAVAALQQLEHLIVVFGRIPSLPEGLLLAGEGKGWEGQRIAVSTSCCNLYPGLHAWRCIAHTEATDTPLVSRMQV